MIQMMRHSRLKALSLALALLSSVLGHRSSASQATLVTPGSPLPMTGLATFLNNALLSIGSCNSGNAAPANGPGSAAFAEECWANTTSAPTSIPFAYYDGAQWATVGTLNATAHTWTPYLGGNPTSETAPLSGAVSSGVLTIALQYDTNFTNNGSNQLALANIASGSLLANGTGSSAEPTGTTPSAWLNQWCAAAQYNFPQRGASSWACGTISGLLVAGTGITLSGTGQVTIGLTNQIAAGGPTGGAATIPVITYNAQGQLTAVSSATANPTQVNGNAWPSSGNSGGLAYWNAANAIASSATLTQYGFLFGGGSGGAPTAGAACTDAQIPIGQLSGAPICKTTSGDATIADTGGLTIGANAVTNAKAAQMAANAVKGNPTGSTATAQDVSPAAARSSSLLNIDECTPTGSSAYTIASTDRCVYHTSLTAAVTDTLPSAASVNPEQVLYFEDFRGAASSSNTVTTQRNGTDTVNGSTTAVVLNAAFGKAICTSDGSSRWTCAQLGGGGSGGSGTVTSVGIAGTSGDISASGTCAITTSGTCTIDLASARKTLPTIQSFMSGSGTYTTPANVLWIEIDLVGGGGGGQGGGTSVGSGTAGTAGGNTCWNTSGSACTSPVYQAGGGSTSSSTVAAGGSGGTISGSGTCNVLAIAGGAGQGGTQGASSAVTPPGGIGGSSTLGGAGVGNITAAGSNAVTNSGSGGGGGGASAVNAIFAGGGGGAGATCRVIINNPAASYIYAVGAGGGGGSAGTSGLAGGSGAAGRIVVIEHYGS
jgi:hypothetical protein